MGANWANRESHDFYVYTLSYPDETVFYVGKGIDNRINEHEKAARKGIDSPTCDVIRTIWAMEQQVIKTKIYTGLSQKQALLLEQETIDLYEIEYLTNKTSLGHQKWITPEWRTQRSQAAKQKWDKLKTQAWWKSRHP